MNSIPVGNPCEDYEFDVAELVDGTLAPEKARIVRLHLAGCARCRRWRDRYAAMDARLARVLPVPRLPADFDWKLAARIGALDTEERRDRRADAEREYATLLSGLRGRLRAATLSGIASWAAAAGCALAVLPTLLERARPLIEGQSRGTLVTLTTVAVIAATFAWSFGSGVLPGLRAPR
jgi:anti-sigma factor RsiW